MTENRQEALKIIKCLIDEHLQTEYERNWVWGAIKYMVQETEELAELKKAHFTIENLLS